MATSTTQQTGAEYTAPVSAKGHRAAVIASFLGWTLDAFDYWLVAYTLTAIGKEFGQTDKSMAFANALTLFFRPVGAIIFGLAADRWGRKKALMANLVFFSTMGVLTGFASSYSNFLIIRALFGVGMGGEWGVGSSLAMEKTDKKKRGIVSGLLQEGYACGNLLAAVCFFLVFPRWGWRPMFFIGGLPALLALYVRTYVTESEVWERTKHNTWGDYVRALAPNWPLFLYLFVFLTFMGFVSHGTQDMYPTFLKRDWHFTTEKVATISIIANFGAIIGGILFGHFSDKIGRKKAIISALLLAVLVTPLWSLSPTLPMIVAGGFLMQFMVQGAWGIVPAHINELVPDSVRGFLPGFAYQCGMAVSGIVAYIEALFADRMSYAHAMAMTGVTVFVMAAIATYFGREKRGVEFGG